MPQLRVYVPSMQPEVERFFKTCFTALGWGYEPQGRHADIPATAEVYMRDGCMWCLYENDKIIGTSAIRAIAPGVAELKRLYVLPEHQGKGYGRLLFETALRYAREHNYEKIRLDTRYDRSASKYLIESHGFKQIPQYNDNAFAELFYELDLSKPIIRTATVDDAGSIHQLNLRAFGYEYGLQETTDNLSHILKKPNIKIFVAEIRGSVVGYIHGSDYDCTYSPPLKNILALGILEEHRGQGIGRMLLKELEAWAQADGCDGVRLVSGFNRADAHKFYLRCGYTDRKDQKNFIKIFDVKGDVET